MLQLSQLCIKCTILQRLYKIVTSLLIKDLGEKLPTPCSIGVVIEKSDALDYDYIMERSDAAMYEAKAKGKNTYHILH